MEARVGEQRQASAGPNLNVDLASVLRELFADAVRQTRESRLPYRLPMAPTNTPGPVHVDTYNDSGNQTNHAYHAPVYIGHPSGHGKCTGRPRSICLSS